MICIFISDISSPWNIYHFVSDPEKVDILFKSEAGQLQIVKDGTATDYSEEKATDILSQNPVIAIADVKQGDASATAWGCDLTFDYRQFNVALLLLGNRRITVSNGDTRFSQQIALGILTDRDCRISKPDNYRNHPPATYQ